jgi:TonB family protein
MKRVMNSWVRLQTSLIACSALLSFSGAAICQQQETAEQLVEKVRKAMENREWGRAKSGIGHALALEPELPEANFIAAQVYLSEGARSTAIEYLNKAIEARPFYPEAHFMLAQCLFNAHKVDQAREEVNTAINQGSPFFQAYYLLGEIEFEGNKLEAAISSFETALRFALRYDDAGNANLQEQIERTRKYVENLRRFAELSTNQKANDLTRPVLLNNPQPRYTEEARRLKIQGAVSMGIFITENGDVDSVLILRGLGHGLDEQATKVARELKFSPATQSGKTIPFWMKLMVEFNLK